MFFQTLCLHKLNELPLIQSFFNKQTLYPLLDLLGSDAINDWVEGRGYDYIEISQKDMDILGDAMTKAVSEKGEESWTKEGKDDTNMGATGIQSLQAGILGGEVEDSI